MLIKQWKKKKIKIEVYSNYLNLNQYATCKTEKKEERETQDIRAYNSRKAAMNQARKWRKMYDL